MLKKSERKGCLAVEPPFLLCVKQETYFTMFISIKKHDCKTIKSFEIILSFTSYRHNFILL